MIARHTFTYLGSRGLAAIANVASLAILTRLTSADTYGAYLLILSWAFVLCGFACQWSKFTFFALYDEACADAQIATLSRILLAALGIVALACVGAVTIGLVDPATGWAIAAVALGMTVVETAIEISRTRLEATSVAAAVITRSALILVLGTGTLLVSSDAVHLALATALANVLAAWLPAWRLGRLALGRGSVPIAWRFLVYGWPLILSFGVTALGQNVDRVVLGGVAGAGTLGAYGAISDFLKQSFVVFGEAIALSMISIAKQDMREGDPAAARATLATACRALTVVSAFGSALILTFSDVIVGIVLGPGFRGEAMALAPYLVIANVFLIFRAFYFGQVIYFAGSSRLDPIAAIVLFATVGGLSLALVPVWGVTGAAVALVTGQGLACLVFVVGAPGAVRLPVPLGDMLAILATAFLCCVGGLALRLIPGFAPMAGLAAGLALMTAGFFATLWYFDILGLDQRARFRRENVA